jgi:hypothetical protein
MRTASGHLGRAQITAGDRSAAPLCIRLPGAKCRDFKNRARSAGISGKRAVNGQPYPPGVWRNGNSIKTPWTQIASAWQCNAAHGKGGTVLTHTYDGAVTPVDGIDVGARRKRSIA